MVWCSAVFVVTDGGRRAGFHQTFNATSANRRTVVDTKEGFLVSTYTTGENVDPKFQQDLQQVSIVGFLSHSSTG